MIQVVLIHLLVFPLLLLGPLFATLAQEAAPPDFAALLTQFGMLGGVGALIAAIVNILKAVGLAKDGDAPKFSMGLNLLALAALFGLGIFRPGADIAGLDKSAGELAGALIAVFGFVWQLMASRAAHSYALKGVPLIGKTYTPDDMYLAVEHIQAETDYFKQDGEG